MNTLHRVVLLSSFFVIASCGGGGGGGGSDYDESPTSSNTGPEITNTQFNISVQENQMTAFQVLARDYDGDTLSYSLSGTDSSLMSVSSSGLVTFNTAPDFENPSDSNGDNVYLITVTVSDGSASTSADFSVTVTNDTSDDVTTEGFDGTLVAAGPVQGATICIQVETGNCTGAQYTTSTSQDGTFSLTVDSGTTGVLRGEGGFDPVTNLQFSSNSSFALGQPVTDQNVVVTPLSTLMNEYNNSSDFNTFKTKLGLDSTYMIRYTNPFSGLDTPALNKAAVVNTQILVMHEVLNAIHTFTGDSAAKKIAGAIYTRTGTETSLGDTTFIKDMLTNLDTDFSPTSDQLVSLSAGISAYMQKINATSSNSHSHFAETGVSELKDLMKAVMDGTSTNDEIDKLVFNTINWINENTSWDGGSITDNESEMTQTIYSLSNNGNSNYVVDNINTKDKTFIIYVREGDIIKFDPTSSVTASHPFLMSTENNDMDKSNDVGSMEGWNKDTLTLTVNANTPDTLYPHCEFHSGMYTNSKIVKVTSFDQTMIDIENTSTALQVKGTVATGPYKGASGFTYKVYLTSQGGSEHTHTFHEYPGLTFYMPGAQGHHGAETATDDTKFKAKSHYADSNDGNDSY